MGLFFKNISHAYGAQTVLQDLTLHAKEGEITCLLGPSGGGKSTLLRLAAGLEDGQAGRVLLDDQMLMGEGVHMPPEKRPVGLLFQEYALFPHLNVADNIAFGLHNRKSKQVAEQVGDLLESVGLAGFEKRFPHTLSGGQQQRVALARALAPAPQVLLMDEPFASIDSTRRRALREETRRVLKAAGAIVVMVTHDPEEALEMADHIAILDSGKITQQGSPEEVYQAPTSSTVAALFGAAQTVAANVSGAGFQCAFGSIAAESSIMAGLQTGQLVALAIRSGGLEAVLDEGGEYTVQDQRFLPGGRVLFVKGQVNSAPLRVEVSSDLEITTGARLNLKAAQSDFFVFPA